MTGYRSSPRGAAVRSITWTRTALAAGVALACLGVAHARPQPQGNMGLGLRELVEQQGVQPAARADAERAQARTSLAVADSRGRVRVNVHLDGKVSLPQLQATARKLGVESVVTNAHYRHGVFTAFVPVAKAKDLAKLPGVKSVQLSTRPIADVGTVTSQGAATVRADQVNALGITGAGVTVGVMSDSYDAAAGAKTHAAQDIASGDLPGTGNPNGHTEPVVVIEDIAAGSDEGRAMAQIVHDVAPAAKLCFATAFNGEVGFADNIRKLADKTGPCKADVIVDDVIYFTEPMFSDGVIAQAADEVVAQGVSYFSSAGNRGSTMGYLAGYNKVDDAAARASAQTVDLSQIAAGSSNGGFHNLATDGTTLDVSRTITFGATSTLVLQWNDPFDAGKVTTDYDLYVYNAAGDQLAAVSADDNFSTDQPIEAVQVPAGTYQIVVVRSDTTTDVPTADQVRFVTFGSVVNGEYMNYTTPITFGHNSAAGANGTAAFAWFQDYLPESFSSPGPSIMYFGKDGSRLPTPEIRKKPDIGAPDGVNTTFFSADTAEDSDTFPNFFGTSAAAPHAAAVAALVIDKAGGPGSISPKKLTHLLKKTARAHDSKPNFAAAQAAFGAGTVHVTVTGDGQSRSQFDTEVFRIGLTAPEGYTLKSVTLDLSTANGQRRFLGNPAPGIQLDPRVGPGLPVTLGSLKDIAATDVSFSALSDVAPFSKTLTVNFAPGSFGRKSVVHFGVDRDEVATGGGGNSADLLVGGTISGVVAGPGGDIPFTGTFTQALRKGYSPAEGLGLIDALSAVQALP
jgi:hypothetical protein